MGLTAERQLEHIGETKGCADHDHDLVHELSRRLSFLWRCDQYIANAKSAKGSHAEVRKLWEEIKTQELENVKRMKELIGEEIRQGCF